MTQDIQIFDSTPNIRGPKHEVWKTSEAAAYLRISVSSLTKWRITGYGPKYIRIGPKAVRYRQEDLDAWMAENVVSNTSNYEIQT